MKVSVLMTEPAITCHAQDSLNHAAHLMWEWDVGALPVVDDHDVVTGMITDRDICMGAYTQGKALHDTTVSTVMSRTLVACHEDDPVAVVQARMREHRIRRVPVIDGEGHAIGVLSMADLVRQAAREAHPPPSSGTTWSAWGPTETLAAIVGSDYEETLVPAA